MKSLLLMTLASISAFTFAQSNAVSLNAKDLALVSSKSNTMEAGMAVSSINNGTVFATISYMHEYQEGYALGVRGNLPLEFSKQSNTYAVQGVGRFMFVNDVNRMYLEANLTQGFFNDIRGTKPFWMIGGDYGYARMITRQLSVGGRIGLDFATARLSRNEINRGASTLYNTIALEGSYFF